MTFSTELITLGRYLAGLFDNREQAIADPAWYVRLHLWLRPVPLFIEDSIALFAEQANIVNLDHPYRPRILRLRYAKEQPTQLQVQYYMFKNPDSIRGAGGNPELLNSLTPEHIQFLPSCTLTVTQQQLTTNIYQFSTKPATDEPCRFTYEDNTYQVFLGFDATPDELRTYDKGIDPSTGKVLWGATMGSYRFTKIQDFSSDLPV